MRKHYFAILLTGTFISAQAQTLDSSYLKALRKSDNQNQLKRSRVGFSQLKRQSANCRAQLASSQAPLLCYKQLALKEKLGLITRAQAEAQAEKLDLICERRAKLIQQGSLGRLDGLSRRCEKAIEAAIEIMTYQNERPELTWPES